MLSPQHHLQTGWDEYKSGNYSSSIIAFERALSAESGLADAYNGLGWAYISYSSDPIINLTNLNTAFNKFDQALAIDSKNSDAWVGKAILIFINRESKQDLNEAIKAIDTALQGEQIYLYRHDYDSKADLHALKAQCYYYLDEYEKATAEIENTLEIEKENQVALKIKTLL
ncbi:hypothetical protein GF312_06730 [Candidatus Poribacteria bacterium]|nr:hypothetical protein [Candidatus Poribacteria bacterium]